MPTTPGLCLSLAAALVLLSLRQAGVPVYGVSGIFYDIGDVRTHGRDERIGVQAFYEGVEFMYRLRKTSPATRINAKETQ